MPRFDATEKYLKSFRGVSPIFPLGGVVLFPQGLLPLHIFEPRYRAMTADALASDGFMAITSYSLNAASSKQSTSVQKSVGQICSSECSGVEAPAVQSIVGLGKIIASDKLPDGRYYLALQGLTRARILEELPTSAPYRTAQLECLPDACTLSLETQNSRANELLKLFFRTFPEVSFSALFQEALDCPQPLAVATDLLAAAIPFAAESARHLLEMLDSSQRSDFLQKVLTQLFEHGPATTQVQQDRLKHFPPSFSTN